MLWASNRVNIVRNNGLARNMNVVNSMCAVMFSLLLPRCAAREQDLHSDHPLYYGAGNTERFMSARAAFLEVVRGCSRSFAMRTQ